MPFTLSHAVIALPFRNTPLVSAALAAGAVSPDTPLFFPIGVLYAQTHSPIGAILIAVPLALAEFLVWMMAVRVALKTLMPAVLRARLPESWSASACESWAAAWGPPGTKPPVVRIALVIVSLLIGVASHIVVDDFTHEGRAGVLMFPRLGESWGAGLPGYVWLQYISSLTGLMILFCWALWRLRGASKTVSTPNRAMRTSTIQILSATWLISVPAICTIATTSVWIEAGASSLDLINLLIESCIRCVGWVSAITVCVGLVLQTASTFGSGKSRRQQ